MRTQYVFFRQPFVGCGIDGADRPRFVFPVADVHTLIGLVVAQIVDVSVKINGLDQTEGSAIVDVALAMAAGGKKLLGFGCVDHSLWIRDSGNAVAAHASADVDNLQAVVSQGRDDQLVFSVKAEMVEAPLDTRHRNRFGQDQRSRSFGRGRFLSVQSKCELAGDRPSEANLKSAFHSFLPKKYSGVVGGNQKWSSQRGHYTAISLTPPRRSDRSAMLSGLP